MKFIGNHVFDPTELGDWHRHCPAHYLSTLVTTPVNYHCLHSDDMQSSMFINNKTEDVKLIWVREHKLLPSSLVLLMGESVWLSFISTWDCAEIAACAAAAATLEPTIADKNATW